MVWGEESLRRLQNHQVLEKDIITTVAKYIFLDAGESMKLSFLLLEAVSNERVGCERDSEKCACWI